MDSRVPSISVCTIIRNEFPRIKNFITSCSTFVDEIIFVDTGSSDGTCEVLKNLAQTSVHPRIKFFTLTQTDGFHYGMAKNFSISKASSTYCIILDADEFFDDNFKETIRLFLIKEKPDVASVVRKDIVLPHLIDHPHRIIRRTSGIAYGVGQNYRVHEQLVYTITPHKFSGIIWHNQSWNHYVLRPQRILFQLELEIDRTPKTKSLLQHWFRGVWYFWYRFKKIYVTRDLYKDGALGFKYAFMRAIDAFLIEFFVGLKPKKSLLEKYIPDSHIKTPSSD